MSIRIFAVGKKHESWIEEGVGRYEKRLKQPFDCQWILLPHSSQEEDAARGEESRRLLERIKPDDFIILLDEKGALYDSPGFSKALQAPLQRSQKVVFVIGGAYGVDDSVHVRANIVWSLSPLVFPHQLVRLLLVEQAYRAQEIALGHPYHHK